MGLEKNLLDLYISETIKISVLAKERDKTVLLNPATATFSFRIGVDTASDPIYEFTTTPEVSLVDIPTAKWLVTLPSSTIPLIEEGVTYRYDIYTTSAGGDQIHQAGGAFVLQPAV